MDGRAYGNLGWKRNAVGGMIYSPMPDRPPDPPAPALADARPDPPRFWWLKRGLAALALLILGLIALRLIAGWSADRRLGAIESDLRAAGRPVVPADLNTAPPPDASNAAFYLKRAAGAVTLTKAQEAAADRLGSPAFTPADLAQLRGAVAANAAALADAHAARDLPEADWAIHFRRPMLNVLLPNLNPQRELANLLRDAIAVQTADGHSAAAVGTLLDLLLAADAQLGGRMVVANLVGVGISDVVVRQLERHLPDLVFEGEAGPDPAPRSNAQALIRALLDDRLSAGMAVGMDADRVALFDTLDNIGTGWTLRPFFRSAAAAKAGWYESVRRAAQAGTLKAAKGLRYPWASLDDLKGFTAVLDMDSEKSLTVVARNLAARRLAAAAVAVRLYRVDHDGKLPPTLQALVPAYLPAVPADPMRPDGGPIGYAPAGQAASPRVYSVGVDGVNDGGVGGPHGLWTYPPKPHTDDPFPLAPPPGTRSD